MQSKANRSGVAYPAGQRQPAAYTGSAGAELRSVLPAAAQEQQRRARLAAPELDELPLGVLTSHAWGEKWVNMHRELATRSHSSFHRITSDRGHNIHMRHPDLVADAIRDVAAAHAPQPG